MQKKDLLLYHEAKAPRDFPLNFPDQFCTACSSSCKGAWENSHLTFPPFTVKEDKREINKEWSCVSQPTVFKPNIRSLFWNFRFFRQLNLHVILSCLFNQYWVRGKYNPLFVHWKISHLKILICFQVWLCIWYHALGNLTWVYTKICKQNRTKKAFNKIKSFMSSKSYAVEGALEF